MTEAVGLISEQEKEEPVITPELKLSTQLWATCNRLLQEKGKTSFSASALFKLFKSDVISKVTLGIKSRDPAWLELIHETEALRTIRHRRVDLTLTGEKKDDKTPRIITVCGNLNPLIDLPPYLVDVYISPKTNKSEVFTEFLRLIENGRPEIMMPKLGNSRLITRKRWATTEDLTYYKNAIDQSLPIEHK